MSNFPKITCVIYDLDGLLLDTEPLNAGVNRAIARRYGKTFNDAVKSQIAGRNAMDTARIIIKLLELPLTPQGYIEERTALISGLLPHAQLLPGAVRLIQHLHRDRIPQALATSSAGRSFQLKTSNCRDLLALFDCIVLGDDPAINQGKPAPDIFLIAAQRLQASPEECLVFEDSPAGIEAAKAAGMFAIAVPDSSMDKQLYRQADRILNSLTEFEPQLWQLPAFDS